ncbi:MAG: ATP synthase F1 subunit delta [Candidatus Dadabacteria bacterium]|nr:ATP synthase F1 subunit delta [Candidatus Dadabacteria bacterium]NIS07930.1 ATP synthase F1 subunit delta [Candidatus Dadabacteria bacterium]NIY21514.1 ATP synthase F1 subunit delta [Candidatus Dadabacteria bacterium]
MATVATLRDLISALIETSVQSYKLPVITSDMEKFFELIAQNDELKDIFGSTVYKLEEKISILSDVSQRLGLDAFTVNFLNTVIEMDKIKGLVDSRELILRRLRKAAGIELAEFIFAKVPEESQIMNIQKSIEAQIGNKIEVAVTIDPEILGGVIVKVSNKLFDNSIRTKLNKVKNMLTAA